MELEKYLNVKSSVEVLSRNENQVFVETSIAGEYPLTLYVNKKPLVTLMTMGQDPEALALGYLKNQSLISSISDIKKITIDWDTDACVISLSENRGSIPSFMQERTVTSGCGQGTMLGNLLKKIDDIQLPKSTIITQTVLHELLTALRTRKTVYKKAGAVHGCALIKSREIIYFTEDVGRHNAVDAIAGKMMLDNVTGHDKYFYTTGRLTSEMVIKCIQMEIPVLISRSGATHMGWKIANDAGLTMIGRANGRHFLIFSGEDRFEFYDLNKENTLT